MSTQEGSRPVGSRARSQVTEIGADELVIQAARWKRNDARLEAARAAFIGAILSDQRLKLIEKRAAVVLAHNASPKLFAKTALLVAPSSNNHVAKQVQINYRHMHSIIRGLSQCGFVKVHVPATRKRREPRAYFHLILPE